MVCPRCNTENDESAEFCIHCGYGLRQPAAEKQSAVSPGTYLLMMTVRFLIAIFGLWVLKEVLVSLSFIKEVTIPNFPLTVISIINLVFFLLLILLIIGFAALVARMWPRVFPGYTEAGKVINVILYLIILSVLYQTLRPMAGMFQDGATILLILQITLSVIAFILILWVAVILYRALPGWLNNIRQSMVIPTPYDNTPTTK
jgi:hypothetical protein